MWIRLQNLRVRLIGSGGVAVYALSKGTGLILRDTVMVQVRRDRIADRDSISVLDSGNRNESLELVANV